MKEGVRGLLRSADVALRAAASREEQEAVFARAYSSLEELFPSTGVGYISPQGGASGSGAAQRHHALTAASSGLAQLADQHRCTAAYKAALLERAGRRPEQWGSGPEDALLERLSCANIDVASRHICGRAGVLFCGRCGLVAYCRWARACALL